VPAAEEWRPLGAVAEEFTSPNRHTSKIKALLRRSHLRADPETVRKRLLEQLQPLCARYGFVLSEGRYIWKLPPVSWSKGTAALIEDHQLGGVVFLGDDVTDLSAMAYLRSLRGEARVQAVNVGVMYPDSEPAGIRASCDVTAHGPGDVARVLLWIGDQLQTV
jgi:trehalose-phosphatase